MPDALPQTATTTGTPPARGPDPAMSAALARNWWAVALRGVLSILFGLFALLTPGVVLLSLALAFAVYLLADGVLAIVSAIRAARAHERWGLLLGEGVLNILMGLLAALFPVGAVFGFVIATAAWALVTGVMMVGAGLRLEARRGRTWLILGGVVSAIWGVMIAIAPVIGAVVLTWWLGAYAFAFGVALLVLALRLRGRAGEGMPPTAPAAA
jgi:uncharacterized membrane protein HdeD (DUF308 family)